MLMVNGTLAESFCGPRLMGGAASTPTVSNKTSAKANTKVLFITGFLLNVYWAYFSRLVFGCNPLFQSYEDLWLPPPLDNLKSLKQVYQTAVKRS
jgi:hypothetical protein